MDEYSPRRHDIVQLTFLCESLRQECLLNLNESNHGWVNDPTSVTHLQLNDLIEHIATFTLNYKIKYVEESHLPELIDEYLDDSFMLFSNYSINAQDLNKWQDSEQRLFRELFNEDRATL